MVITDIGLVNLQGGSLDFGNTILSGVNSAEREIIISNSGSGQFDWTITGNEATTSITPTTGTVSVTAVRVKIHINTAATGLYSDPITVTASNGDTTVYNFTIIGTVIDSSITGKTFCEFNLADNKITWTNKVPTTYPTKVRIYYYHNDFAAGNINIDVNAKFNQTISGAPTSIKYLEESVASYIKGTDFNVSVNTISGSTPLYIYKIAWDGGEALASTGALSGGAAWYNP